MSDWLWLLAAFVVGALAGWVACAAATMSAMLERRDEELARWLENGRG